MNITELNIFPVYALPASIKNVVIEIQQIKKASLTIIASSLLHRLSIARKALIDVRLRHSPVRKVNLFMTRMERLHETPSVQNPALHHFVGGIDRAKPTI